MMLQLGNFELCLKLGWDVLISQDDSMTRSYHLQQESGRSFIPISRVPSAPGSLKGLQPNPTPQSLRPPISPLFPRKSFDTGATPLSPRLTRRPIPNKASPGLEENDAVASQSPPVYRRMSSREETSGDVFSRLGAGMQDPPPGGRIREFDGKARANVPLHCTHVVEGHTNSVLSVRVIDTTLFTAAADRTVKVWDMTTGTSSHCLEENDAVASQSPPVYRRMSSREETSGDVFSRLGAGMQDPPPGGRIREFDGKARANVPLHCTHVVEGHTNSVLSVRVIDTTLFTAAADRTVKVWDLTTGTSSHCLSAHPGPVIAVEYDSKKHLLFSASAGFIRAWDLRMSTARPAKVPSRPCVWGHRGHCTQRLRIKYVLGYTTIFVYWETSGGHQAAVMCVTAWSGPNSTDFVATGSKDHYVKVFEVPSSSGLVLPLLHLEPPHYDGVQALTVANDGVGVDAELFSGSRDTGIKRWDLRTGELKQ
uniref:Uncharacterized protein n=1 Tax=Lutzomyia longipalpis TaxID=7200 RepID=A0A1B0EZ17_LUTLO